jgi:hypothetical protein
MVSIFSVVKNQLLAADKGGVLQHFAGFVVVFYRCPEQNFIAIALALRVERTKNGIQPI